MKPLSVSQRAIEFITRAPAPVSVREVVIGIGIEPNDDALKGMAARMCSFVKLKKIARTGTPCRFRYTARSPDQPDLPQRQNRAAIGRAELRSKSITILPRRPGLHEPARPRAAPVESVDAFIARGGRIETLPAFGHPVRLLYNDAAAPMKQRAQSPRKRTDILDEQTLAEA